MGKQNGDGNKRPYGGRPTWKRTPYDDQYERMINHFMDENDWTQPQLAERMAVAEGTRITTQTAHDALHLQTQPTLGRLYTMTRVFGVSPAAFFTEEMWRPSIEETLAIRWEQLTDEQKNLVMFLIEQFVGKNAHEGTQKLELATV